MQQSAKTTRNCKEKPSCKQNCCNEMHCKCTLSLLEILIISWRCSMYQVPRIIQVCIDVFDWSHMPLLANSGHRCSCFTNKLAIGAAPKERLGPFLTVGCGYHENRKHCLPPCIPGLVMKHLCTAIFHHSWDWNFNNLFVSFSMRTVASFYI